jgi:hypothetical protein
MSDEQIFRPETILGGPSVRSSNHYLSRYKKKHVKKKLKNYTFKIAIVEIPHHSQGILKYTCYFVEHNVLIVFVQIIESFQNIVTYM